MQENLQDLSQRISNERHHSTAHLLGYQLQWIVSHYILRNETEVRCFLKEYPFLTQLLIDLYHYVGRHFPDSQILLAIAIDYEAEENHHILVNNKEIVVSISTSLPSRDAMKRLNDLYSEWWLSASTEAKGKISIGLEFA